MSSRYDSPVRRTDRSSGTEQGFGSRDRGEGRRNLESGRNDERFDRGGRNDETLDRTTRPSPSRNRGDERDRGGDRGSSDFASRDRGGDRGSSDFASRNRGAGDSADRERSFSRGFQSSQPSFSSSNTYARDLKSGEGGFTPLRDRGSSTPERGRQTNENKTFDSRPVTKSDSIVVIKDEDIKMMDNLVIEYLRTDPTDRVVENVAKGFIDNYPNYNFFGLSNKSSAAKSNDYYYLEFDMEGSKIVLRSINHVHSSKSKTALQYGNLLPMGMDVNADSFKRIVGKSTTLMHPEKLKYFESFIRGMVFYLNELEDKDLLRKFVNRYHTELLKAKNAPRELYSPGMSTVPSESSSRGSVSSSTTSQRSNFFPSQNDSNQSSSSLPPRRGFTSTQEQCSRDQTNEEPDEETVELYNEVLERVKDNRSLPTENLGFIFDELRAVNVSEMADFEFFHKAVPCLPVKVVDGDTFSILADHDLGQFEFTKISKRNKQLDLCKVQGKDPNTSLKMMHRVRLVPFDAVELWTTAGSAIAVAWKKLIQDIRELKIECFAFFAGKGIYGRDLCILNINGRELWKSYEKMNLKSRGEDGNYYPVFGFMDKGMKSNLSKPFRREVKNSMKEKEELMERPETIELSKIFYDAFYKTFIDVDSSVTLEKIGQDANAKIRELLDGRNEQRGSSRGERTSETSQESSFVSRRGFTSASGSTEQISQRRRPLPETTQETSSSGGRRIQQETTEQQSSNRTDDRGGRSGFGREDRGETRQESRDDRGGRSGETRQETREDRGGRSGFVREDRGETRDNNHVSPRKPRGDNESSATREDRGGRSGFGRDDRVETRQETREDRGGRSGFGREDRGESRDNNHVSPRKPRGDTELSATREDRGGRSGFGRQDERGETRDNNHVSPRKPRGDTELSATREDRGGRSRSPIKQTEDRQLPSSRDEIQRSPRKPRDERSRSPIKQTEDRQLPSSTDEIHSSPKEESFSTPRKTRKVFIDENTVDDQNVQELGNNIVEDQDNIFDEEHIPDEDDFN